MFTIIFFVPVSNRASSIDTLLSDEQSNFSPIRLGIVIAGSAGIVTIAHVQNYNSWWKGERSSFHFGEDGGRTLGADKFGHFYFTYLSSDLLFHSFRWAGADKNQSLLLGAGFSLAFQFYVEVEDGFTKSLGFSSGDALSNIAGAFYPFLQSNIAWLNDIRFKWSCYPSERYRAGNFRNVVDDYESMYFWLSVNNNVFPASFRSFIPAFFGIAIGYGVKNLDQLNNGSRELYLALDYDFTKLPGEGSFLKTLKYVLNYVHFPSPAIRLTPSFCAYGLHF